MYECVSYQNVDQRPCKVWRLLPPASCRRVDLLMLEMRANRTHYTTCTKCKLHFTFLLVFICLKAMIFCLLLFSAHFLNIPKTNPKFYRGLLYFSGITMLLVVCFQIFFCMDAIGKIHSIEFSLGFIWLFLLLYMTISAYQKKQKEDAVSENQFNV